MALPAARALRSYCIGISHGPVSATIPNAEKSPKVNFTKTVMQLTLYIKKTATATATAITLKPL